MSVRGERERCRGGGTGIQAELYVSYWQRQSHICPISRREKIDPPFDEEWPGPRRANIRAKPEILLRPILDNTIYHTLLGSSFIHLSFTVCQARSQNHSHKFSASQRKWATLLPWEWETDSLFFRGIRRGSKGDASTNACHTKGQKELTSQQAGVSLEPKKDFSKQRFVLKDMLSLTVVTFLPSSHDLGLSRGKGHRGR